MACKKFLTLNNGLKMPILGLGTWRAPDDEVEKALNDAIEIGYRHIDAAPVYLNEKVIGKVLKKWVDSDKIKREEFFITTKLPPTGNRARSVEECLKRSLDDLQLSYVDMYLIHTPFTFPETTTGEFHRDENGDVIVEKTSDFVETWKKMEEMVEKGLTKSIGISNFNEKQTKRLLHESTIKPANLQIELHVYLQQHQLVNYCKDQNIAVTAYSPLGSKGIEVLNKHAGVERELPNLLEDPVIVKIANRLCKEPAQILLKWILERGVATVPKSTNPGRLRKNFELFDFDLTKEDMAAINELDKGIRVCDFSIFKGANKHPEFPW